MLRLVARNWPASGRVPDPVFARVFGSIITSCGFLSFAVFARRFSIRDKGALTLLPTWLCKRLLLGRSLGYSMIQTQKEVNSLYNTAYFYFNT